MNTKFVGPFFKWWHAQLFILKFYNFCTQPFELYFTNEYNLKDKKMKKILILIAGILIVSCSNDDTDKETELVSVTTNYYADNNIWSSEKLNYVNQQLHDAKNSDTSRTEYTYGKKNLLAAAANYGSDNVLYSTNNYTFDSSERLTEFKIIYSPTEVTRYTIVYGANSILYTMNNVSGNSLVYEFALNSDKQIIGRKTISVNGAPPKANSLRYQYNYEGQNLISVTSFNPETNITTSLVNYTYGTTKNEVDSSKHIYGKAWKMNSFFMIIINQGNYTPQVSENLVSSYKEGTINTTINRAYSNGKISKMTTEYTSSFNIPMKIESIYEYK